MVSFNVWVRYQTDIRLLYDVKNKHFTRRFKQIENKSINGQFVNGLNKSFANVSYIYVVEYMFLCINNIGAQ